MTTEPSVLDFILSRLMPWKYERISFPPSPAEQPSTQQAQAELGDHVSDPAIQTGADTSVDSQQSSDAPAEFARTKEPAALAQPLYLPWRSLLALGCFLIAQWSMTPGFRKPESKTAILSGVILLLIAAVLTRWAYLSGEISPIDPPRQSTQVDPPTINLAALAAGSILAAVAFVAFGGLLFNLFNLALLITSAVLVGYAFWAPPRQPAGWRERFNHLRSPDFWTFKLSWGVVVGGVTLAIILFFRFYRLGDTPLEMNSDHAEKFLDVLRVLNGQTLIFFPTNGGREALQFYLVAALHRFAGLPMNFYLLKLVTASVGFLSLPFIYLLGKEFANPRVGWLALLFAGTAYWPNVVARVGMRLPFYILFTAALLYFLLHGIRTSRRNYFVLAGAVLGLSFYGYSADRILPLLVMVALGLYLLHAQSKDRRHFAILSLLALISVSFVLFLPLLRYIVSEPDAFLFRTLTRMGTLERPIDAPVWLIFLNNLGRALAMFSWSNGQVWVISIPYNPALGVVSGGLFYLGLVLTFLRYLRSRNWLDLFLILSIPLLMLPSIMALAFPDENPNLYRTGGAMVPVFLIVGLALDSLVRAFEKNALKTNPPNNQTSPNKVGVRLAWGTILVLFAVSALQDYDLVFNQFHTQYRNAAWNSSEMGKVVRGYIDSGGSPDNSWVVGAPHWVDTRLVALNAGYPGRDFQIKPDELDRTLDKTGSKLFLVKSDDLPSQARLTELYPDGWLQTVASQTDSKDFLIFIVPPIQNEQ
jgi:hypothetical protein